MILDTEKGFSLIELIVCVAVLAIILGLASPSIIDWRRNLNYKKTSREITSMFREARHLSISRNIQHMVVVDPANREYRMFRGSRANNTPGSGYATLLQEISVPNDVTITRQDGAVTEVFVQFNPNGTAILRDPAPGGLPNDGRVSVRNGSTPVYLITVTPTGRISSQKV